MRQAIISVRDGDGGPPDADEFMSAVVSAGLADFEVVFCDGNRITLQVAVENTLDKRRLAELPPVEELERVTTQGPRHTYLVTYSIADLPCTLADGSGEDDPNGPATDDVYPVFAFDLEGVTEEGLVFTLKGTQETIRDAIADFQAAGADVSLRSLRDYETEQRPLDTLTARQRDVLRVAHETGYFDVPRNASMEDIGAELDLDPSTVSEHLQRAQRNLLSDVFS